MLTFIDFMELTTFGNLRRKNIWVVRERTLKKNKFLRQKSQMKQKFPSPEQRYETK